MRFHVLKGKREKPNSINRENQIKRASEAESKNISKKEAKKQNNEAECLAKSNRRRRRLEIKI